MYFSKSIPRSKLIVFWVGLLSLNITGVSAKEFGTYATPFSVNSLWNSKPVNPKFKEFQIPTSIYYPAIQQGKYSTGVFQTKSSDPEGTIYGYPDKKGVWDPDSEVFKPFIKIPHWPSGVVPAEGSDGHADVVDESLGIIHSFWQLKLINGKWVAAQYAWTKLNGTGWSDPAHYFQGARAAAVPSSAGIIRQNEMDDGKEIYEHALAISLAHNALSKNPTYVFPATSADSDADKTNSGDIPEGALLMLPPDFDISRIKTPKLIKVAKTLKTYGAYVVDRNVGTPFVVYVENGSNVYSLKKANLLWDSQAASELHLIREGLRQVSTAEGWLNGNGERFTPDKNLNLLSMRGPWRLVSGNTLGEFSTADQAVNFGKTASPVVQENISGRSMQIVNWAKPKLGDSYKLTIKSSGGAKLTLKIVDKTSKKIVFQSKELGNGESEIFTWPADDFSTILTITSGVGDSSSLSAELLKP